MRDLLLQGSGTQGPTLPGVVTLARRACGFCGCRETGDAIFSAAVGFLMFVRSPSPRWPRRRIAADICPECGWTSWVQEVAPRVGVIVHDGAPTPPPPWGTVHVVRCHHGSEAPVCEACLEERRDEERRRAERKSLLPSRDLTG